MDTLPNIRAVTVGSLLGVATGVAVMAGWVFNIPPLLNVFPGYVPMKFNTALCFILLSAALLLTQVRSNRYKAAAFLTFSFFTLGICTLSLSENLFNVTTGLDQWLVADKLSMARHDRFPGRMEVNTASCFALFSLALLLSNTRRRMLLTVSQYLLHAVTVISGLALLGYLYGLPLLYHSYFDSPMAVHTAVLLFLLSLVASLLHPATGIAALFTGVQVGNMMARRVFSFVVGIIVVFGAIRIGARLYGWFSGQMGFSLLVICFMAFGLALLWHTANWLNRLDTKRHDAEEEVKVLNEMLEKRVEERSSKLRSLLSKLRESEIKFRAAFEHSAMGMALVSLKGTWMKVNKRLCDMVGYREQELLSMTFHDLTHPGDSAAHGTMMEDALKNTDAAYRVEKRYICKNGTEVWVSINIATVTNKKGGPVYFVGQFEDITARKKVEKRLKDAYKQIRAHVNSIKKIAWKQSHLVRSPLANLKGLVDILKDDPFEKQTLEFIQVELERLDTVILEMAEDAYNNGATEIMVKKRCLTLPALKLGKLT